MQHLQAEFEQLAVAAGAQKFHLEPHQRVHHAIALEDGRHVALQPFAHPGFDHGVAHLAIARIKHNARVVAFAKTHAVKGSKNFVHAGLPQVIR